MYSMTSESTSRVNAEAPVIPWGVIAAAALLVLALALYAGGLHLTALSQSEATAALSAWRFAKTEAPGEPITPTSPLLFAVQSTTFILLSGGEAESRIGLALLAAALVMTPLLLRGLLGTTRALLWSLLLVGSAVLLIGGRSSSPVVLSALLAMLTLWAGWRFSQTRATSWGVLLAVTFISLILLAEPGGLLLALALLGAALLAHWTGHEGENPDALSPTPADVRMAAVRAFPWAQAVFITPIILVAITTAFLTHLNGLSAVSALLEALVVGFTRRPFDSPIAFPLLTSLHYDTWLWVLASGTILWMLRVRRVGLDFFDRFCLFWLTLALIASVAYSGAHPDHALWLTLPLTAIISRLALTLAAPDPDSDVPLWGRWLVGGLALSLLAMGSLAFQGASRSLSNAQFAASPLTALDPLTMVVLIIVIAFFVVGYFLVRSFWESDRVPLQGVALAFIAFAVLTGIGSGWRSSVDNAGNPVDFWQRSAASNDALLLRESLMELAERETRGYAEMPITVLSVGDRQLEWVVRDFERAIFVQDYAQVGQPPVLLAAVITDTDRQPPLQGGYLGQDFVISRVWPLSNLSAWDLPQWWSQRRASSADRAQVNSAILWVRADVFAGDATGG